MTKRQVSFLFENTGSCVDVFCSVEKPSRYYCRNTESGAWYSSTPSSYEPDCQIREDIIFEVLSDGVVCALDGNSDFDGKKPFVPFCHFERSLAQSFAAQHPHLRDYDAMKKKLLSLPGGESYTAPGCCWENWVFALDFDHEVEEEVGRAQWMNNNYRILAVRYTHKPTGFEFINYRFRSGKMSPKSSSHDMLLYDWETQE